ncbi:MAG TPA: flagellar motor switch protein FliN [Nitrospiraceae bacterium]|jgi:flagellar motor switch protein FliN/FliY|nr:flagellar motor switch protein FliN [Nitrospiraceae bacterium]
MSQTAVDANFEELKGEKKESPGKNDIEFLLDIPLEITVELGRTRMLIKDLLQLGQGSVVELEKVAGEPMEVLVNNRLVARGEVVVINEKFGVRLTDIISPTERIRQLK